MMFGAFTGLTAAGGLTRAYSSLLAGKEAEGELREEEGILLEQAQEEQLIGRINKESQMDQSRRGIASLTARYAKAGLVLSGTPAAYIKRQSEVNEFNILSAERASQMRVRDLRYRARIARDKARSSRRAGYAGAFSSVLSTGASLAGGYLSYKG